MSDEPVQKLLIEECCKEVKHLRGDAVEIGVHKGDSAALICEQLPESTVYMFDTFTGMPAAMITKGLDEHPAGSFNDTSLTKVLKRFAETTNAVVIPGLFPESVNVDPSIKFAHVDVDLYLSTKAALEWCWPRMVEGGVMLDDDYLCSSCAGAKKAVDEFVANHGAKLEVKHRRAIIRRRTDGQTASCRMDERI